MTVYKIHTFYPNFPSMPLKESGQNLKKIINRAFQDLKDVGISMWRSKLCRPLFCVVGALTVIVAAVLLGANPPGWLILAAVAAAAVIGHFTAPHRKSHSKEVIQELQTIKALCTAKNYREIDVSVTRQRGRLYVGKIQPNRIHAQESASALKKKLHITHVFSINTERERRVRGFSVPNRIEDYHRERIEYAEMQGTDFNFDDLDLAADHIHNALKHGNLYIHSLRDVKSSAIAVAAYLIKYGDEDVDGVCDDIESELGPNTFTDRMETTLRSYAEYMGRAGSAVMEFSDEDCIDREETFL
jgi:hypothetical protein